MRNTILKIKLLKELIYEGNSLKNFQKLDENIRGILIIK